MRHQIPHNLPFETAKKATRAALESYKVQLAEYHPTGQWVSDTEAHVQFRAAGQTMEGKVVVLPTAVELDLTVPFFLRPFKSIAMQVVEAEIQKWLDRARKGEFDEGNAPST